MILRLLFIFIFSSFSICTKAQVMPLEGDTLNYRVVGFSVSTEKKYKKYFLEIAAGNHADEKSFKNNIITTSSSANGKWVEEVPMFGQQYTWRVAYKGRKNKKSPYYHFATGSAEYTDTSKYRMRIIDTATRYQDILVLLDFVPLMYNMKGQLVWYLPDMPGVLVKGHNIRDLKYTSTGTFTLLNDLGAFEFDYHGKLLWKAPDNGIVSGDSIEHYHHEITKLDNSHYLIAGNEQILRRVPPNADTTHYISDHTVIRKDNWFYKKIDCATLIEYDARGNVVWNWKLSAHLAEEEYFFSRFPGGMYNSNPHLNSFFFDEQKNEIYISLRNLNRIMKIKYPEGNVLAQYGEYLDQNGKPSGQHLFRAQHCARVLPNGDLMLFNNNTDRETNVISYVDIFEQPRNSKGNLQKVWEFGCDIDTNAPHCGLAGGSVLMLPDSSILVGMGQAGRSFIVSRDKKIIWNAIPEYKNDIGNWNLLPQYRTHFILNKIRLKLD